MQGWAKQPPGQPCITSLSQTGLAPLGAGVCGPCPCLREPVRSLHSSLECRQQSGGPAVGLARSKRWQTRLEVVPKYQGVTTQGVLPQQARPGSVRSKGWWCGLYLQVDFPWVFSQFGQWYMSMSGASSSSTPTQLKCRKYRHHWRSAVPRELPLQSSWAAPAHLLRRARVV